MSQSTFKDDKSIFGKFKSPRIIIDDINGSDFTPTRNNNTTRNMRKSEMHNISSLPKLGSNISSPDLKTERSLLYRGKEINMSELSL